jgi:hypothetical protein
LVLVVALSATTANLISVWDGLLSITLNLLGFRLNTPSDVDPNSMTLILPLNEDHCMEAM